MAKQLFEGDGHYYELKNHGGTGRQKIWFVQKRQMLADGSLKTISDGITNETLIEVLIHRLQTLDAKVPSVNNDYAIDNLRIALDHLQRRTEDRLIRGVNGTFKE